MFYLFFSLLIANILILKFHYKLSKILNIYDEPDNKVKLHSSNIALLGGSIVFLNLVIFYLFLIIDNNQKLDIFDENFYELNFNSLLVISSCFFLIGLYDDKFKIKPTKKIFNDLLFAFNICRNVKSNAIVLTKDSSTIGIGSGQPSRIDSCKIAIDKMKKFQKINQNDIILGASDAFFPFTDGIETLVQNGVSAIIQPSGSIRDKEIIKFANETDTVLLFSKTRHFRH